MIDILLSSKSKPFFLLWDLVKFPWMSHNVFIFNTEQTCLWYGKLLLSTWSRFNEAFRMPAINTHTLCRSKNWSRIKALFHTKKNSLLIFRYSTPVKATFGNLQTSYLRSLVQFATQRKIYSRCKPQTMHLQWFRMIFQLNVTCCFRLTHVEEIRFRTRTFFLGMNRCMNWASYWERDGLQGDSGYTTKTTINKQKKTQSIDNEWKITFGWTQCWHMSMKFLVIFRMTEHETGK